jgi:glutathione S-transferase
VLKIWGRVNSINVQKVLWCADELKLQYQRIDAGLQHGVVKEPWYLAMNPNARVPTIEDDGYVLWESNVIVRYLAAKYPAGGLYPAKLTARADAERWMDWCSSTLGASMTTVFWGLIRTEPEKRDLKAIAEATQKSGELFTMLDAWLARHLYIAGDEFSMGDIPAGCFAYRWLALPIERPALPHLDTWYKRLQQRPAFKKNVMLPLT